MAKKIAKRTNLAKTVSSANRQLSKATSRTSATVTKTPISKATSRTSNASAGRKLAKTASNASRQFNKATSKAKKKLF